MHKKTLKTLYVSPRRSLAKGISCIINDVEKQTTLKLKIAATKRKRYTTNEHVTLRFHPRSYLQYFHAT